MALADLIRQTAVNDGGSSSGGNTTGATPTPRRQGGLGNLLAEQADNLPEAEVDDLPEAEVEVLPDDYNNGDNSGWFYQQPSDQNTDSGYDSGWYSQQTSEPQSYTSSEDDYYNWYEQPERQTETRKETPTQVEPIIENTESSVANIIEQENENARQQISRANSMLQASAAEDNNNLTRLPIMGRSQQDLDSLQSAAQATVEQLNRDNGTRLRANVPETTGLYNWNWRNGPSLMDNIMNIGVTPAYAENVADEIRGTTPVAIQSPLEQAIAQVNAGNYRQMDDPANAYGAMDNAINYMRRDLGITGLSPQEEQSYARQLIRDGVVPEPVTPVDWRDIGNRIGNAVSSDIAAWNDESQLTDNQRAILANAQNTVNNREVTGTRVIGEEPLLSRIIEGQRDNPYYIMDKAGQSLSNRVNGFFNKVDEENARLAWVYQQPEYQAAQTTEEKILAEDTLSDRYDEMVANGQIEGPAPRPLVTSADIHEQRDAETKQRAEMNRKQLSGVINFAKTAQEYSDLRGPAEQSAIRAGYQIDTPEFEQYVQRYINRAEANQQRVQDKAEQIYLQNIPNEPIYKTSHGDINISRINFNREWTKAEHDQYSDYMLQLTNQGYDPYSSDTVARYAVQLGENLNDTIGIIAQQNPSWIQKNLVNGRETAPSTNTGVNSRLGSVVYGVPGYNADGTPNETMQAILNGEFTIDLNAEGLTPGSPAYEVGRQGNASRILHQFDVVGDRDGFTGITVPESVKKFMASSQYTAQGAGRTYTLDESLNIVDTSNPKNVETVDATAEEMVKAVDDLIAANKSLQDMISAGLITRDDVMYHFFKGINPVKETESKSSYRSYGGGGSSRKSYSSGSRSRSYGGYSGGGSNYGYATSQATKDQKQTRINNIMKNWTF